MATKKTSRCTNRQFELLVKFMEDHPKLISGKLDPSFTVKTRQELWKDLAELLNSDGVGPTKDPDKWRKTWIDWKSNVKSKALQIRKEMSKTGGGPQSENKLTSTEEKLLNLIGWVNVEENNFIEETGLGCQATSSQEMANIDDPTTPICIMMENCSQQDGILANTSAFCSSSSFPTEETTTLCRKRRRKDNSEKIVADVLKETEYEKVEALNRIAAALEKSAEAEQKKAKALQDIAECFKLYFKKD